MNQNREKCKLSICAIMKNEGHYLKEWLEFHKLVGVERFYLYNNYSSDNTLDILAPYIENCEVVLKKWPVKHGQQMKAYNHFLQKYKNESKWIAFIDLDEFLFPTEKNDLREILEEFSDVPAVGVNWLIFGTSGYEKKPEGLQIENFTKRAKEDFKPNLNFKCIVRSEFTIKCNTPHHFVYLNDGVAVSENYEKLSEKVSAKHSVRKLRINHYFTRSMEEALNKVKRGRATVNYKRKIGDIKYHNRNEVEDLTIQRFIPKLKATLQTAEFTTIDSNTTDNSDEIIDKSLEGNQLIEEVENDYLNKQREKCKLSICAIMKNEGPYLEEWLEFHKLVGVEKFYLYDNNSTDNTQKILQFYIQNRQVIYYYWPEKPGQIPAYNHCLNNHRYDSEWIAFIDLDEFLFPTVADKITDIIDEFSDVSALGVNWLNFGTSGHEKKPEGLQIENFIKRAKTSFGPNKHIKCILRPEKTIRPLNPHQFVFSEGQVVTENKQPINKPFSSTHSIKKIRINHYTTRSKEESMKKMMRGRATKNEQRPWSHFESKDLIFNEVEDLTIHRYIPQLKKSLAAVAKKKSKVKLSLEKSNSLLTIGNLGKVVIENELLKLTGWIVSLNLIPISGFKVWIGGEEYRDFKQTLGIESPRIKKARPRLKGAEKAKFCIEIPLNKIHRENYQDLLIILIPILANHEGCIFVNVFNPSLMLPTKEYIDRVNRNSSLNFQSNAFKWLGYLIQRTGLKPTDSILDIGCGIGEVAYGLAYYLTSRARYEGIEFSEKVINWAKEEITSRKPNFNFQWHNIYHPIYNTKGTIPTKEFILPYPQASFDVICISNLFTHLSNIDLRNYLYQIQRVLKVGGKCLFACFLINSESQKLIADGKSSQNLVNEIEGGFCLDLELPEKTIGFQESLLIDWIKESGLTIVGKYYGSWCGRKSFTYQDLLIVEKKTEFQSKFNNYQTVLKQYKLRLQKIQGELGN
ncbi:MAG: glycosyltransferase family 92 protein [Okeania sp. SIO2C2]|uniref:glycosyltransferase family 92 protein n=1 Tax=Okeania sp. SIO2C2 TaxID=2607787 RepID=UPI0013BE3D5A|nr:glycosyltransferase family 92 protein [Okeania sp. SIO2C2]NEP88204.1 glycosyltransferase family 92 protein [Okeania sp. SIO2C2]